MILNRLLLLLSVVLTTVFVSCKKGSNGESQPPADANTPLRTAVNAKNPADTIYKQNSSAANFGYKFYPLISGNVLKLGCRMPVSGSYEVSLWEFDSKTLLAKAAVTVTVATDFSYAAIPPLTITVNKRYVVSVNNMSSGAAQPYYQLYKLPTTSGNLYPFTSGNIVVEAPYYKGGATSVLPDQNNASDFPFMRGVADIEFVKAM